MTDAGEPEVIHDGMLLAIQRLREVELTERTFTVREEFSREEPHIFGLMREEPFRVKVSFCPEAAAYVRERRWSADQTLTLLPDGGLLLEFTAASRPEVVSWVLSFGAAATLLEPQELKEEVKATVRKMAKNYE